MQLSGGVQLGSPGVWRGGPQLAPHQVPPGLGSGQEAASGLRTFAQAVPAAWDALPPWSHWLNLPPPIPQCDPPAGLGLPSPL